MVDLQYKFLWVMSVLQSADARPSTQAQQAVATLEETLAAVRLRWSSLQ